MTAITDASPASTVATSSPATAQPARKPKSAGASAPIIGTVAAGTTGQTPTPSPAASPAALTVPTLDKRPVTIEVNDYEADLLHLLRTGETLFNPFEDPDFTESQLAAGVSADQLAEARSVYVKRRWQLFEEAQAALARWHVKGLMEGDLVATPEPPSTPSPRRSGHFLVPDGDTPLAAACHAGTPDAGVWVMFGRRDASGTGQGRTAATIAHAALTSVPPADLPTAPGMTPEATAAASWLVFGEPLNADTLEALTLARRFRPLSSNDELGWRIDEELDTAQEQRDCLATLHNPDSTLEEKQEARRLLKRVDTSRMLDQGVGALLTGASLEPLFGVHEGGPQFPGDIAQLERFRPVAEAVAALIRSEIARQDEQDEGEGD